MKVNIGAKATAKIGTPIFVEGKVSAIITDENNISKNVTVSIKNAMLALQKHNILPLKLSLNEYDSINFIYNTKIIEQEIISRVIVDKIIPLTSEELESRKKEMFLI